MAWLHKKNKSDLKAQRFSSLRFWYNLLPSIRCLYAYFRIGLLFLQPGHHGPQIRTHLLDEVLGLLLLQGFFDRQARLAL